MLDEVWKDVPEYEGLYKVSNMGRVYGIKRNNILSPAPNEKGYMYVVLCKNNKMKSFRVHRLVAKTFLGDFKGMEINHIDGNKKNNELSNLEYCTHKENMSHAILHGLENKCKAVFMLDDDGNILKKFNSVQEAEKETNAKSIARSCKTGIRSAGYRWKYA